MKILVFSDSHGRTIDMYSLIESEFPDAVIHLGDHYEDASDLRRSYPDFPIYAVRGNNDFEPDAPLFSVIAPAGVRMYLTHGQSGSCVDQFRSGRGTCRRTELYACAVRAYPFAARPDRRRRAHHESRQHQPAARRYGELPAPVYRKRQPALR